MDDPLDERKLGSAPPASPPEAEALAVEVGGLEAGDPLLSKRVSDVSLSAVSAQPGGARRDASARKIKCTKASLGMLLGECIVLVLLSICTVFFGLIAYGFFVYARWSVPFVLAAISCLVPAVSLLLFLPEHWAKVCEFAGESSLAGRLLVWSCNSWQKLVGDNGPAMAGKLSFLLEYLVRQHDAPAAKDVYDRLLPLIQNNMWKFPGRAESALKAYHTELLRLDRRDEAARVKERLGCLKKQTLPARMLVFLLPLPVVAYLSATELLVRSIANNIVHGQTIALRTRIKGLADIDTVFFGNNMGAKVYWDYANTLRETCGDDTSALWCARSGLVELKQGNGPPVASRLLTLIGAISFERGEFDQAREALNKAIAASPTGSWESCGRALGLLAELESMAGRNNAAEALYLRAMHSASLSDKQSDDYLSLLDKAGSLQASMSAISRAADTKMQLCEILLARCANAEALGNSVQIEEHRRLTRELDACAALLREVDRTKEAAVFSAKAVELRNKRVKPLVLGARQQSEIVAATTRVTNLLLSVKYKALGWRKSLQELRNGDLHSKRAQGAIDKLPWLTGQDQEKSGPSRRVEVDMAAMKVRNFQEPDTLAVDVSGTVHIIDKSANSGTADPGGERFAFAYLLKRSAGKPPSIECVVEN